MGAPEAAGDEPRPGGPRSRRGPQMRECCVTRESKPVSDLIRFALSPEGEVVPDVDARAPGRGVWVVLSEQVVAEAVRRNAFSRGLKQKVRFAPNLAQVTKERLEGRLSGALGLARKAGALTTGATRVRAAIDAGQIAALLTATDAAADGRQKMLNALRARLSAGEVPHFELLSSSQMGLALGLENVIHAALVPGPAANSAIERARRLSRYIGAE